MYCGRSFYYLDTLIKNVSSLCSLSLNSGDITFLLLQTINHKLQGTDLSNLSKVEQAFLQSQVEIITIYDDDEPESFWQPTNESVKIREVIHRDLPDIDEGTLSIINTIQAQDQKVHSGQDEDTLALVDKLEKESELEQRNYEKEKQKKLKKKLAKIETNFPKLDKGNSQGPTQ